MKELPDIKHVHIKPCYPHVIAVQKQRKFKDLFLIKDIYDHCKNEKSLFELFFYKESLFAYERRIKHVFANCWLNEEYFPNYERITSIEQIDTLRDGILFCHDLESLFNSRGSMTDKDMNALIDIVNNAGKHRLQIRGSAHRDLSVDCKIRSLVNLWVVTQPYFSGSFWYLENYMVTVEVYDSYLKRLGMLAVNELQKYAGLYDTEEESRRLQRNESRKVGISPLGETPHRT